MHVAEQGRFPAKSMAGERLGRPDVVRTWGPDNAKELPFVRSDHKQVLRYALKAGPSLRARSARFAQDDR